MRQCLPGAGPAEVTQGLSLTLGSRCDWPGGRSGQHCIAPQAAVPSDDGAAL